MVEDKLAESSMFLAKNKSSTNVFVLASVQKKKKGSFCSGTSEQDSLIIFIEDRETRAD